jgi:RND family efflux transporter MFP subunit
LVQRKRADLAGAPAFGERPRPVTVVEARKGEFTRQRDYLAVVEPATRAEMTARVSARVMEMLVDEGERVRKGQPLVRLDAREPRQQLNVIDAQIAEARAERSATRARLEALEVSAEYWRKEASRFEKLGDTGAVPVSDMEKALQKASEIEGELEAAQQQAEALTSRIQRLKKEKAQQQTRLGYYTMKSPMEGVITRRHVDPGDMASLNQPLCEVEPANDLRFAFDVPQEDVSSLREGLTVRYQVNGQARQGPLELLYPTLNRARMMRAEVPLNKTPPALTSGAYVPVSVVLDEYESATLLPRSCLIDSPEDKPHVFTVTDGRLTARAVEVLGFTGETVAVRGVEADAKVVHHTYLGWATLTAGEKVEPIH